MLNLTRHVLTGNYNSVYTDRQNRTSTSRSGCWPTSVRSDSQSETSFSGSWNGNTGQSNIVGIISLTWLQDFTLAPSGVCMKNSDVVQICNVTASQWSGTHIRTWHGNDEPTAWWRWFTRIVSLKTNRSVLVSPWPSLVYHPWTTEHMTVCIGSHWQTELSSSSSFQQLKCSGSVSAVQ